MLTVNLLELFSMFIMTLVKGVLDGYDMTTCTLAKSYLF